MPLGKDAYEKAIGRKLTDAEYEKLTSVAGGPTSRAEGAYEGASLAKGAKRSSGPEAKAAPTPFVVNNEISGKKHTLADPTMVEDMYKRGLIGEGDIARYRGEKGGEMGGYKAPAMSQPRYVANVPAAGGGTKPLYLWHGDQNEVESLVKSGTIDRRTADRIYATTPKGAESGMSGQSQVALDNYASLSPNTSKSVFGDEMSPRDTWQGSVAKSAAPKVVAPVGYGMGSTNVPGTVANKAAPPDRYVTIAGGEPIPAGEAPSRTYSEGTMGDAMSASKTGTNAALKAADKEGPPLGKMVAAGGGTKIKDVPFATAPAAPKGPGTPLMQAVAPAAPAQPSGVAAGMTAAPEEDDYAAIIANARKKFGL